MKQELSKEKQEQQIARVERQEYKAELAENYANLTRKPPNRRKTITFIILAIILVLGAIFTWLLLLPSESQTGPGIPLGKAAPEFTLPIYGGIGSGKIDLHALQGHPVLINFWSLSCPPCKAEIPFLQQFYAQYGSKGSFVLLGVNQADPKDDIASFGNSYKLTYPLLFDPGGSVNSTYGVTAIPTTFFIDSKGIVRSIFVQPLTQKTMRQGLASVGIVLQ